MHELSICETILAQVTQLAAQHQAEQVTRITVHIGLLSGIEPDLLVHAFSLAREGTIAQQADLITQPIPITIRCQTCGLESAVPINRLVCSSCGDWHTTIVSGDELLLASVELLSAE